MTRKEFFTRTFAGVLASVGLAKAAKAEKSVYDGERLNPLIQDEVGTTPCNYIHPFRSMYQISDQGVTFRTGMLKTSDPELIKALSNHPACKK